MSECTHHWTVTSPCPFCQDLEITRLKQEIKEAYELVARANRAAERARADSALADDGDIWLRVFIAYTKAGNSTKTEIGFVWADRAVEAYRSRFGGK